MDTELGQDVLHVALHGQRADAERLGHIRRRCARGEGAKDLAFSRREPAEGVGVLTVVAARRRESLDEQ